MTAQPRSTMVPLWNPPGPYSWIRPNDVSDTSSPTMPRVSSWTLRDRHEPGASRRATMARTSTSLSG